MEVTSATYDLKFSRIRNLIFGKTNPPVFTQITCIAGLVTFLWFFGWYLLNLLALHMIEDIDGTKNLKMVFYALGEKYNISDVFTTYYLMVLFMISASVVSFAGILLVWRRFRWAYFLFFTGTAVNIVCPVLFLGMEYFLHEMNPLEYFGPLVVMLMFGIDLWLRGRVRL